MKVDWWWKSIDDESWLMMKVDWWWKSIDDESWLMMKVEWWKSIDDESRFDDAWWNSVTNGRTNGRTTLTLESLCDWKTSARRLEVAKQKHLKNKECLRGGEPNALFKIAVKQYLGHMMTLVGGGGRMLYWS